MRDSHQSIARARRRRERWLDLCAVLAVAGVAGLVFWVVPPLPAGA
jgi:ferric-dicitrate binding protein FerR (iron transport regulator)